MPLRLCLLICLLPLFRFASGQLPEKKYYFTHYATNSGLVSNEVSTVVQDNDGFIWVGTNDGMQRFDGTRFRTYRYEKNNRRSLPSNLIWQLVMDRKKDHLWILTGDGHIGIWDTHNLVFHEKTLHGKTSDNTANYLKKLIIDEQGNVLLLTQVTGELLIFNEEKNDFSEPFIKLPPGYPVISIAQEPGTSRYWVGFQEKGFGIYDHKTKQISFLADDGNDIGIAALVHINTPYNFYFDRQKRLWFQSWGGGFPYIYCYDRRRAEPLSTYEFITTLKSYYEAGSFFEQKDGSIWISGLGLLARFNEKDRIFELTYNGYQNERSIYYERVNLLSEDREDNIWIATSNNGLYRLNPSMQFFNNVAHVNRLTNKPGKGSLLSFVPTKWGTLLAGTWGDGLFQYDRNFNLIPANISGIDNNYGPTAWCSVASRDSVTLWLSSQPGIWKIDQQRRTATYYDPDILQHKTMRQLVEDRQGHLWFGMHAIGLFRWDPKLGAEQFEKGIHRVESVPPNMINKLMVDHEGLLWVGTATGGVYVLDPATEKVIYHFNNDQKDYLHLTEPGISSLLDYDDSLTVISTSSQLFMFNRRSKVLHTLGDPETMSGLIASMEQDRNGNLWVSTTTGIYRVNPKKRVFLGFNRDDGIDNDHFILGASRTLPDGRMVFGSSDQFVVFDPLNIKVSDTAPAALITEFIVGNKSLNVDSLTSLPRVELRYNSNSVVIGFSTLTYTSAGLILYKMEGLDNEWRSADKTNEAIYSYLPTGRYVFMMKTVNEQGESNGQVTRLVIRVNPPFWKTWWFYSLLLILIGAIVFGLDRERMKRKEAIQKMRTEIADNLHTQVNTALNNINILSEMARLKAEKDPGKSKEYIEQIHSKSHNMIIAMDDMLWSLDPENDSIVKTTERMREYIDALQHRYGVNIDMQVDRKVESLQLNMKLRHEAFLVFKEGIKNLITVGAKNLHVFLSFEKGNLLFSTQFDNDTCDLQQLNNLLHRQDLESRLTNMNARIDIDVHKTHSLITLEVPVI